MLTGNALVTGAGSGIGRAVALRLAREGVKVWAAGIHGENVQRVASEILADGGDARARAADVTQKSSVEQVVEEIYAEDKRLDIVVANAGVSSMNHFLDLHEADWDHNFRVNVLGTFLTLQTCGRRMIGQDFIRGRGLRSKMIAVASRAGRRAAPLLAHYSATKFAVIGMVQAAAKELAAARITVNAVNPGAVTTPMQEREVRWEAALRDIPPEDIIRRCVNDTPLGRLETPEDVAGVIAFLAGPDSDFMTGEVIEINGGSWIY